MACANWYAFGRIAWDHALSSDQIADEWIRMTFSNDKDFVEPVAAMMSVSHEAAVNYMTPLGLHHLMARGHHYGPGPWVSGGPRADWTSIYYHRADSFGIGFDRTGTGSGAVDQYFPPLDETYGTLGTVPEKYLLWFHHVPWDHTMPSGRTLWEELAGRYQQGVDTVRSMQETWRMVEGEIDEQRYEQVRDFLAIQRKEAEWWRDSSLLYFQSFSGKPLPAGVEKPAHSLEHYMETEHPYAPGI
jgi:alpha-glucuronidase